VFGRIHCAHVADQVLDADGRVDAGKLDLIGRMGGDDYCTTRERFTVDRPGH
jgi:flavin reductase (DIM6/NTAB) family NADH-FMN oxidoreductase RutF